MAASQVEEILEDLHEIAGCVAVMDETGLRDQISKHLHGVLRRFRALQEWQNAALQGVHAATVVRAAIPLQQRRANPEIQKAFDILDAAIDVLGPVEVRRAGAATPAAPPPADDDTTTVEPGRVGFSAESLVAMIQHDRSVQDAQNGDVADSWAIVLDAFLEG